MDSLTPLFGLLAFLGLISVILGLGWVLKNKTSLGEFGVGRPSFMLKGSYRLDSKNMLHVFTLDGDRFVVITGPSSVCLIDKNHADSRLAVDDEIEGVGGEKFGDQLDRISAV